MGGEWFEATGDMRRSRAMELKSVGEALWAFGGTAVDFHGFSPEQTG